MFGQTLGYGRRPSAHYRAMDVTARVEGASPHRLVAILYEELLVAIASAAAAVRAADFGRRGEQQARALKLVAALRDGLDYAAGGEVARTLASVYGEVRRLLMAAVRDGAPERFDEARALVAEMAEAWGRIG